MAGLSLETITDAEEYLRMFVLDALHYDIKQIETILILLNGPLGWRSCWPQDFTRDEVTIALQELLDRGDVSALDFDPESEHVQIIDIDYRDRFPEHADILWYRLTRHGRQRWEEWEDYPVESAPH